MTKTKLNKMLGFGIILAIIIAPGFFATAQATESETTTEPAATNTVAKTQAKKKQCVVFFSPQYKKTRIKPIKFEFRWCDKSKKNDCSKWKQDKIVDEGRDFSVVGHCFTYAKPIHMEFRYNQNLDRESMSDAVTLKPQAFTLKEGLEPHAFCTRTAIHRMVIKRGSMLLKSGKPGNVKNMRCVWKPTKAKAKTQ